MHGGRGHVAALLGDGVETRELEERTRAGHARFDPDHLYAIGAGMVARADWTAWWNERGQRELSLILWALWDPVGDVPLDEYDVYALGVLRFLLDREPPEEIAVHLSDLRMRLDAEPDPEHDREVARKLQEWFR